MPEAGLIAAYTDTLRALDRLGVRSACVGTFGLHLHGLLPQDYALHDADLAIAADEPTIAVCYRYLLGAGWQMFIWDEPLDSAPSLARLQEKFYLRARKGELCLDLVFGGLFLDIDEILSRAQRVEGIGVAALADIVSMKQARGRAADCALLARIGLQDFRPA